MSKTLRSRPGFTLIELLVVIAIIAVLMGLVVPAVISLLNKREQSGAMIEVAELNEACKRFNATFKSRVPSSLIVSNNAADFVNDPETSLFFTTAWPRIDFDLVAASMQSLGVTGKTTLEGDQCMVLLLGGPPDPAGKGATGLSANPRNPFDAAGAFARKQFFQFPVGRLVQRSPASPFLSFKDPWGGVYAYFSPGRRNNGYVETHCATLGAFPYFETPPAVAPRRFFNPNTCQIISAGKNQMFGPGGFLNLASPAINAAGADDVTNFAPGILAAGQGG